VAAAYTTRDTAGRASPSGIVPAAFHPNGQSELSPAFFWVPDGVGSPPSVDATPCSLHITTPTMAGPAGMKPGGIRILTNTANAAKKAAIRSGRGLAR